MRIRDRLTIQFTVLAGIILLAVLAVIYFVTVIITHNEFYDRLKERADIAAQIYLDQDELSKNSYQLVQQKFLKTLPDEIIQIFNASDRRQFIENNPRTFFSPSLIEKVRNQNELTYSENEHLIIGKYFHDNQGDFVIFVSALDTYGNERLRSLLWLMISSYILALVILYLSGRIFSGRAMSPMQRVVGRVKQITASNLHLRVQEGRFKDEINELINTFNNMLVRLESSFEIQRTFVSNASHELRTPLTSMIGELEVFLAKDRSQEEYKEALESVLNDAHQLKELINGLLNIAQTGSDEKQISFEEIRLDELIEELKEEAERNHKGAIFQLKFQNMPEDFSLLLIKGNRMMLSIAIGNLLSNAIKFSGNKPVHLKFGIINGHVKLSITDAGIGISETDLKNIFQPFYRGENAKSFAGHGIGLALTEKILALHQISIHVESALKKGTTVVLRF